VTEPDIDAVVVVGASLAGLRACETLRAEGFAGRITVVGDEPDAFYDRPPLSKRFLSGEWDAERIRLRKPADLASLDLDLHVGVAAESLDAANREVSLSDGRRLAGDAVIVATGARCRRLPGSPDADGIVELRTLADAEALRARLAPGVQVVVIGAGFIGLEVAATARTAGCTVTVLEGGPAPLMRGLGAAMGRDVARIHERHGVDVRCAVTVDEIGAASGRVCCVRLADGTEVPADLVVVGIGVVANTEWLAGSGVAVGDGVICDATLAAGPGVWAAGDCARWPNLLFGDPDAGELMRVEHWTNAAEQGAHAARNALAVGRGEEPLPYAAVPFFWSDQFESRIQFVGRVHGDDDVHVIAGEPATGPCAVLYGHAGRLRGVLGVSMPKLVMPFRGLIAARATWPDALAKAAELTA
jgi:3-phenylpropionate/trans-cinnamate dioxygenase ferredoxin reductase subunit